MTSDQVHDDFVPGLKLERYRQLIKLDESYENEHGTLLSPTERAEIVVRLLDQLIRKERLTDIGPLPDTYERQRGLLRALLNIRPPLTLDGPFINDIDQLLQDEAQRSGFVDCRDLPPVADSISPNSSNNFDRLVVWKGDITRLRVDAIVNAANDQMLGCFQPLHNCIDNVIHSAVGPLLRQDCKSIMDIQQRREQTGDAKITRAYNLPSKFVLHTVGPIIGKGVSDLQQRQLASCYRSCLALAQCMNGIKTIAFPCISTGVFNFPRQMAAEIAIRTVQKWLKTKSHCFERVIFNVFLQEDLDVYTQAFKR
jgi:O-acetyl-ADP-ribose deacetylase (regulator of RNase III)